MFGKKRDTELLLAISDRLLGIFAALEDTRFDLGGRLGQIEGHIKRLSLAISELAKQVAELREMIVGLRTALAPRLDRTTCVVEMVASGCAPAAEVARRCGVSVSFIRKRLVRMGIVRYTRDELVCPRKSREKRAPGLQKRAKSLKVPEGG
ncbi:MAG: hypothetical protein LM577_07155 [Thermoproteaceae archaeon]|nr:hypothetical protein [Thermoproteaceae archaeon]